MNSLLRKYSRNLSNASRSISIARASTNESRGNGNGYIYFTGAIAAGALFVSTGCNQGNIYECQQKKTEKYIPGQAIGEGLKGELWKAKFPKVTALETADGSPILMLLSHVRKAETTGDAFRFYADRLMHAILDAAHLELPNDDEAEFSVPSGVIVQGQLLEEGDVICAISLVQDHENLNVSKGKKHSHKGLWDTALSQTFQGGELIRGHIVMKNVSSIYDCSLPENIKDAGAVLLLASEVAGAEGIIAVLKRLDESGVKEEDIVLVCSIISKAACEKACKTAPDLRIIAGAVDPGVDGIGNVIPGIGGLYKRYVNSFEPSDDSSEDAKPAQSTRHWYQFKR